MKNKNEAELIIANKELAFQNEEKGKRAAELVIANKELAFQNEEKGKRAAELVIANKELVFQNEEKEKRAAELTLTIKELFFQNEEKEKRAKEFFTINSKLKETEKKLTRANHISAFISQVNQNIVRINDEATLFRITCSIAMKYGKFKIALIGMFDNTGEKIMLVEHCGFPASDVSLFFSALEQINSLQGPVLKKGANYVCNDIQHDFLFADMKQFMAGQGLLSCIILPIKKFGNSIGILNLYAPESNYFDNEEIALLVDVTGDISFALELFDKEKKQKETEEQLVKNEIHFRVLIENSMDMKTLTNKDGKVLYGSPSIKRGLGYSTEEFLLKYPHDVIHPEELQHYLQQRNELLKTPGKLFHFEQRRLHKNGNWIWCEGTITNMLDEPAVQAMVSNFRDVTEKKTRENEHEFDRNNLSALINNTKDLMWSVNRDFNLITFNQPFDDIMTLMSGKRLVKGNNVLASSFSDEQAKRYRILYERAFAGEAFTEIEYMDKPIESWAEISFYPIRKGDEVIGTACHSRDITDRKKAEENLKQSERRLKEAQALAHTGNWEIDLVKNTQIWSDQFYKIFGIKKGEIQPSTETFLSFMHPDDVDFAQKKIQDSFNTLSDTSFDFRFIQKEGYIKYGHAKAKFEFDINKNPVRLYGIVQDVTERKEAEINLKELENKILQDKIKTQQEITDAIITGQERERSFLGEELHDNINQILAASKLYLETAIAAGVLRKDIMTDSREFLISAMEEIRKLSKSLMPPSLGDTSLQEALSELIELLQEVNKLQFIKEWEGIDESVLNEKMSLTIYRIVQEQMNNIIKYANAKTVTIGLKQGQGTFQLKIKDDGVGFDTTTKKKGIGLKNIASRADSLKGKVIINSQPGEGCELIVNFNTELNL